MGEPQAAVTLRPWRAEDAAAVNLAVAESREHLRPFMPWAAAPPMTVGERRAWFTQTRASGDQLFGAWDATGALVGSCGLHARIDPGGLEIGYWVHVAHVRRGIATAMAAHLISLARGLPDVSHLEIHHDVANAVSGRVPARLGFVLVEDRPGPRDAPAASGRERVWRLDAPVRK